MLVRAFVTLVCLLGVASVHATLDDAHRRSLYFESHGRDDLREWPAAIVKGARYLKIDFNFQPDAYTCAVQQYLLRELPSTMTRMNPATGEYSLVVSPPTAFPTGCFVLCHYYKNSTTDFNTTKQVVQQLVSPAMQNLLLSLPDAADGLVVQMCFKNQPTLTCEASDALSAAWIALMDDFYQFATGLLDANPQLNVRFVFDDIGLTSACAAPRWPRWKSTYTGRWRSTAYNDSGVNAEYQMVNMAYNAHDAWDFLGHSNFLKFANSSYAFVAWEPGLQSRIADFQNSYLGYGLPKPHLPGAIMAYNGDPALYHVFTANTTRQHSNVPVGSPNADQPVVAYLDGHGVLVTCSVLAAGAGSVKVECNALTRGRNARFTPLASTGNMMSLPLSKLDSLTVAETTSGASLYFTGGNMIVWGASLSIADGTAAFTQGSLSRCIVNSTAISASALVALKLRTVAGSPNAFDMSFVAIEHTSPFKVTVGVALAAPLSSAIDIADSNTAVVASSAFPAWPTDKHGVSVTVDVARVFGGELRTAVAWSSDRGVFAAQADISAIGTKQPSATVSPPVGSAPVKVGVGRNPRVSLTSDGSRVTVTYGDSFCYNTEAVDDDAVIFWGAKECNLQDSPTFEFLPHPILVYVHAATTDFTARLNAGNLHRNGFATVCDADVLHGAFDLGGKPAPLAIEKDSVRFGDDSIPDGSHWIVAAAQSLELEDIFCTCGSPVAHGARIVVDAFPVRGFYNRTAVAAAVDEPARP